MKDRLNGYIQGLFAEADRRSPANLRLAELKEELILNTCEKYDDLIAAGRSPEAAYRLAVEGIGDISELLKDIVGAAAWESAPSAEEGGTAPAPIPAVGADDRSEGDDDDDGDDEDDDDEEEDDDDSRDDRDDEGRPPRSGWYALVSGIIWTLTLLAYFGLSFLTHAWSVTWLLFLMGIAADNVTKCIFDLRR